MTTEWCHEWPRGDWPRDHGPADLEAASSSRRAYERRAARVLDLGAGTALTSIFLATEFEVSVIAADLWIDPTENQHRIHAAGVDPLVLPSSTSASSAMLSRRWA